MGGDLGSSGGSLIQDLEISGAFTQESGSPCIEKARGSMSSENQVGFSAIESHILTYEEHVTRSRPTLLARGSRQRLAPDLKVRRRRSVMFVEKWRRATLPAK